MEYKRLFLIDFKFLISNFFFFFKEIKCDERAYKQKKNYIYIYILNDDDNSNNKQRELIKLTQKVEKVVGELIKFMS